MATRTYDIWLMDEALGLDLSRESGGRMCTGIVKLTQRFITCFLTPIGEDRLDPNKGTRIGSLKVASVVATIQVENEIARCVEYIQRTTPDDAADNERLQSAKLAYMSILGDRVYLRIELNSAAGDTRTLEIPTGLVIT